VPIVQDCPCGQQHEVRQAISALFGPDRLDPSWPVRTTRGTYRVPRVYIACHGMDRADIERAAIQHAFERVG
jgi:hypothetical protein